MGGERSTEDTGERRDEQNPPWRQAPRRVLPASSPRWPRATVAPATEKDGVLVDGKGMTLYTYDKSTAKK